MLNGKNIHEMFKKFISILLETSFIYESNTIITRYVSTQADLDGKLQLGQKI